MAYIAPNTDIILMKGVPLGPDYHETIYFATPEAQYNYFSGKAYRTYSEYTFVRANSNTVRIDANPADLYDVNYMMFRNTNYGNKWFYAFVGPVEYINDRTAHITFDIDIMQTYHFDYALESCFVEREHTSTDVIGEHLAPEPVDLGNIICDNVLDTGLFNDYLAVVAYVPNVPSN